MQVFGVVIEMLVYPSHIVYFTNNKYHVFKYINKHSQTNTRLIILFIAFDYVSNINMFENNECIQCTINVH